MDGGRRVRQQILDVVGPAAADERLRAHARISSARVGGDPPVVQFEVDRRGGVRTAGNVQLHRVSSPFAEIDGGRDRALGLDKRRLLTLYGRWRKSERTSGLDRK